jgi:hypothetical protein
MGLLCPRLTPLLKPGRLALSDNWKERKLENGQEGERDRERERER